MDILRDKIDLRDFCVRVVKYFQIVYVFGPTLISDISANGTCSSFQTTWFKTGTHGEE